MKYIKHYYVDYADQTKFLVDTNTSSNGKTHPTVAGLDVKIWAHDANGIDVCFSVCDDAAALPVDAGIAELTFADWATAANANFESIKGTSTIVMDTTSLDTVMQAYADLAAEQQAAMDAANNPA